jgi:hypothetical protein
MNQKDIKKLSAEYKGKLRVYDFKIEEARKEYEENRNTEYAKDIKNSIKILEAKADLLFQVIKDIEDFLD